MRTCALCGKGSVKEGMRSFLRSHYNPTGTIRKYPNLQWVRVPDAAQRVKACVRCMKKISKR